MSRSMAADSSRARRAASILARSCFVALAVVAAMFAYSRTPPGRRAVARRVESLVSNAIPGSMEIDEVTSMWPETVRARGIVFRDPEGRPVIEIDRAAIELDVVALLRRRLAFRSAKVDGARISLSRHGEKLDIVRAFSSGRPGSRRRLEVDVENVHIAGARLDVHAANGPRVALEDVNGVVAFRLEDGKPFRVKLDRMSAKVGTSVRVAPQVRLANLHGEVRANAAELVHLEFGGTIGKDQMHGAFRYYPDRKPAAEIDLDVPDPHLRTAIMSFGLAAAGRASESLRVQRSLGGRPRRDTR